MTKNFIRVFKKWVPLAILTTGLSFMVFGAVQQALRMSANDPQIQMAAERANAMSATGFVGRSPEIDMRQSLVPFAIYFNKQEQVTYSEATLDGNTLPTVPKGVLDVAQAKGENRVTWQPKPGVRIAAVVLPYENGFVLVGRNLREVEHRIDQEFKLMLFAWAVTLSLTLAAIIILEILFPHPKSKK